MIVAALCFFVTIGYGAPDVPNVVIISVEDLGISDLAHGEAHTPTLDEYRTLSINLENYYVSPTSHASRVALMTGMHPASLGAQFESTDATVPNGLDPSVKILPQYLKAADSNFKTHAVGIWDLGFYSDQHLPTKRGYDTFYGSYLSYGGYFNYMAKDEKGHTGFDLHDNLKLDYKSDGAFKTERYAEIAVKRIHEHNVDYPFHLYLAFQAAQIHDLNEVCGDPNTKLEYYYDKLKGNIEERRKCYLALLAAVDAAVYNVIEALKDEMMLQNTVIVFTSTSGGAAAGSNTNFASNAPYRGSKSTVWEGGVKGVSFVYNGFWFFETGNRNCLFHITDWLPTLLHQLSLNDPPLPYPNLPTIYGIDQYDCLYGSKHNSRANIIHFVHGKSAAIIQGKFKLIVDEHNLITGMDEVYNNHRTNDFECRTAGTPCNPIQGPCLFDIAHDKCEVNNLAQRNITLVNERLQKIRDFNQTIRYRDRRLPDPAGNPANFGNTWQPWIQVNSAQSTRSFPYISLISLFVLFTCL